MDGIEVSLREFGAAVGVTYESIRKLVKKGIIPTSENGKVLMSEGMAAYQNYLMEHPNAGNKKTKGREKAIGLIGAAAVSDAQMYQKAKTQEKVFAAKLKQLEVKRQEGDLVPRADIIADAHRVATEVQGRLLAIPARVSPVCEGRSAREIQVIFEDAINEALEAFAKGAFNE